jgi:hypothetical protein
MKKIMFNDRYGLTQAVLDGRKTMTRRIATALNHPNITDISELGVDDNGNAMLLITYDTGLENDVYPHFQIGDELAVAQSYSNLREVLAKRDFKRTDTLYDKFYRAMQMGEAHDGMPGWSNKMFVRADLMPHRIRITNIKVERLQDISDVDSIKEGIYDANDFMNPGAYTYFGSTNIYKTPHEAFASLIDRISGKGTWERNLWVYAYEFELIK